MGISKWHVNPKTGDVGRCTAEFNKCPFGGNDIHFYNESDAYARSAHKMKQIREWLAYSQFPLEEGYTAVHVFYPGARHQNGLGALRAASKGHRVVVEPRGRIPFEIYECLGKSKDGFDWIEVLGVDGDFRGKSKDHLKPIHTLDVSGVTKGAGGRLEVPDGAAPYPIDWYDEYYMSMEQWREFKGIKK